MFCPVWPWNLMDDLGTTIGHLSFAVSSFVQHFIAIGELKLELQSGNAQFGSNLTIFRAVSPWNLTDDLEQDRRWNADKPSAALDPYIPTWLTTSPANHRPANFWFFFLNIEMKLWKVVQPQVQLMSINIKMWSSHSLTLSSTNNHQHYLLG